LETTRAPKPADVAEEKRFESRIGPAIASSYDNLGVHAAIGKSYAIAADYFQHAATWNPALAAIDSNWGQAAFDAERFAQAAAPLGRALQAHPEDVVIRAMLGISQYMMHDYQKVLETLQPIERNLDMLPLLPLAYADSMMKAGDFRQGIQRLKVIATDDPENAAAHRALAEAYRKDGQPQEAEREDQRANMLQIQRPVKTNDAAVEENTATKN
jgi:tetratricopeptide (TPR) repeat protein